jgi:hypothetical protein
MDLGDLAQLLVDLEQVRHTCIQVVFQVWWRIGTETVKR